MAKKACKGCCNCIYSFDDGNYFCGRKYNGKQLVDSTNWKRTKCENWEYDGVSKGFDDKAKGEK